MKKRIRNKRLSGVELPTSVKCYVVKPCVHLLLVSLYSTACAETELPAVKVTTTVNKQAEQFEFLAASASGFAGEDLETAGIDTLEGVARMTPGFTFQSVGQSSLRPPVMRGLTANIIGFSSSVALVVDGVPTLRAQGFDDNLLGIEQVEVLRGPQSTLYGRNAEAGVVNIVTRKPGNDPYATISAEVGSRDKRSLRFSTSHPLVSNKLYLGVAGEFFEQDGFINNIYKNRKEDNRERRNGRFTLRWTPGQRTDMNLRYAERSYRDSGSVWGAVAMPRRTVQSGTDSWNRSTARTLSLDVSHELMPGLRLRSVTAKNEFIDRIIQDVDYMPADMRHVSRDHRFRTLSQEFLLEGRFGQTKWLLGLYADRDDHNLSFGQKTPLGVTTASATQKGSSRALFTHWTVPVADRWTITAGGRVERNDVRFELVEANGQSREWAEFSPKLALQYQLRKNMQVYVSVADGFRSGGFNAFAPEDYRRYQPERVRSFELGTKGRFLKHRLRYSSSVYLMQVHDMHVQQAGSPGQMFLTNAASARPVGLEAELQYFVGSGWQVRAALGLNRTRFREFKDGPNDYKGNRNPLASDFSGYLGIRYDAPKGWYAQVNLNGASEVYLDAANKYGRAGYGVVNLMAGYAYGRITWFAYVHNAGNKEYDTVGFLNGTTTIYSPPREIGLRLMWSL